MCGGARHAACAGGASSGLTPDGGQLMKSSAFQLHRSLKLRGHAAAMREPGNAAEQLLWARLRQGQLGVWFRRQVVLLGSCIVDFYAPARRLAVEVDGGYHAETARRRADARRDR